jgi:hypothetical protein
MHKRKKTISYEAYELEYVYGPKNKVLETQFESGKKKKKTKQKFLWVQKTKLLRIRFGSEKKKEKKRKKSIGFQEK